MKIKAWFQTPEGGFEWQEVRILFKVSSSEFWSYFLQVLFKDSDSSVSFFRWSVTKQPLNEGQRFTCFFVKVGHTNYIVFVSPLCAPDAFLITDFGAKSSHFTIKALPHSSTSHCYCIQLLSLAVLSPGLWFQSERSATGPASLLFRHRPKSKHINRTFVFHLTEDTFKKKMEISSLGSASLRCSSFNLVLFSCFYSSSSSHICRVVWGRRVEVCLWCYDAITSPLITSRASFRMHGSWALS